jgi:DNA-directed RNA polymerase specialized sigma24 family protein
VWLALVDRGYHRLREWDPKRGRRLTSYVALVAWSRWVNKLAHGGRERATAPEELPDVPSSAPMPDARVISADLLSKLWRHLLDVLPAKGVVVLRLVFSFGMTPEDCANTIGQSRQVVDNWLFKIRTEARKFLAAQS